jgi:hypothetical protein
MLAAVAVELTTFACNQRFDFGIPSAAPSALATAPLLPPEPEVIAAEEAGVPPVETSGDGELIEPEVTSLDGTGSGFDTTEGLDGTGGSVDATDSSTPLPSVSATVPVPSVPVPSVPAPSVPAPQLDAGEPSTEQTSETLTESAFDAGPELRPYGCESDAECPLNLHCDEQSTICFECVVDLDCAPPLKRCDGALHRCVECGLDQDCAVGFVCDAATRRCMQGCEEDDDCPQAAQECDDERDVCVACDADWECGQEEDGGSTFGYCGIGGYSCVSCAEHSDCPDDDQVCDQLFGRCVSCRDSRDCDYGGACDPTTYSCTPPLTELRAP